MSGYTKGPLTVAPVDHLGAPAWAVMDSEGDYLALGCLLGDATLYAAAPDMYEALKWFIDDIDAPRTSMIEFDEAVERARAALNKAENGNG